MQAGKRQPYCFKFCFKEETDFGGELSDSNHECLSKLLDKT